MVDHPQERISTSPWIAGAGLLMIGTVFLVANPAAGTISRMWPWELFEQDRDNLTRSSFVLWVIAGALALASSLGARRTTRARLLLPISALLLVVCSSREAAFTIRFRDFEASLLLCMLGGGLLAAILKPELGAARWVAGIAGLLYLWVLFAQADPELPMSRGGGLIYDLRIALAHGVDAVRPELDGYLWVRLVPALLLALAACGAVLIAVGLRWAPLVWATFGLLFFAMLMPTWFTRITREINTQQHLLQDLQITLVGHGFAVWFLCTVTLHDALRAGEAR